MSERLRAALKMLYPDEMTPIAKRILERIIEAEETEAPAHAGASPLEESK